MVNRLQKIRTQIVKAEGAEARLPRVTSNGGLVLVQRLAQKVGLWKLVRQEFPKRKDPTQGYQTEAVVEALVHGLLAGGYGFSATEPMRGDEPLLKMLGLGRAPSAETVEEVVKFIAVEREGASATNLVVAGLGDALIRRTPLRDLASCGGFVPVWNDGSLLEVTGKNFDAIKAKDSKIGQMCVGVFCGPYLLGIDFAGKGEGESTVGKKLIDTAIERVLRPEKLMKKALVLLDSHYGYEPSLSQLEAYVERPAYIVGVMGLKEAMRVAAELAEACWTDTGEQRSRGWEASGTALAWVQCEGWAVKRQMVVRRWRNRGEFIWNYAAVTTNLTPHDARVAKLMQAGRSFAEVVWSLYSYKQAMENQWKDLLRDLSLHNPPCAKAAVNAVFYSIAALAYNLSVGVRRLGLGEPFATMALWRLRREFFELCAYASHHARTVVMRFLDARDWLTEKLLEAMGRLARL